MTAVRPIVILAPPLGLGGHLAACLGRHTDLQTLPATQLFAGASPDALFGAWQERLAHLDHGLLRAAATIALRDPADIPAAREWLEARRKRGARDLFDELAEAAAPRDLVDPSFLYLIEPSALPRLAETLPEARYIHLVRHPASVFPTPEAARRCEALWLRPHLAARSFLEELPALSWLRLQVEWLSADADGRLASLLDWLELEHVDLRGAADRQADLSVPGPAEAPHGVDPALMADPGLTDLLEAPPAPELGAEEWAAAGFDEETRAVARILGYA